MGLTRSVLEANADEYREREPLYSVERESIETLPDAFAAGEFGRRDAEWVVQWYYRRLLGAIPDARRREREERFGRNEFETVRDAITDVAAATDPADRIGRLTALEGVDVPVASAFLFFVDPQQCIVVGEREWTALADSGELSEPYPEPPSVADYESYLERCRSLGDRFDCDMWTLYRALWRLWKDRD
ncbi:hypothetical protein HTZ84_13755 [Haloterrigena sp. SYSU A558-1]|uniref:Uncharacterized protein n=1 Tax=Haloterrigena gelatinilytica TaxID=2741724 RepID=A0A8J8GM36_9EURY|nr:hypothetical protein [Haloterrigena gelatinilytica]NUB90817.1 hypothetical protein [Haloterrigena gelatinilytica]NUC73364.1 hypothetical protein [Haloterrigena gelatinilytica]